MEAEFVELAQRAVAGLEAASGTSWLDVAGVTIAGMQLIVSAIGLGCIVWGLFQMQAAGERRNKEIDVLGKALERQGEMMTQALQGLQQQGEVLAELLRRRA